MLAVQQLCGSQSTARLMSGRPAGGSGKPPQLEGRVELRDISFCYPARPEVQVFRWCPVWSVEMPINAQCAACHSV